MYDEGMVNGILLLWSILTAGALAFLVYDFTTNTPMMGVMKLAWFLVLLYTGPVGLFLYLLSCRQPLPGTHDAYISPHWKQAIGSMMHCVAGDATGIILAAGIVYAFGLPNGIDLFVEYAAAFAVGLLVFQALFMLGMYGGYWKAVRGTFFAEFVSMNMVMVGMFPVMLLLMHEFPGADNPLDPRFWGVMSVATMAGMVTAFPINSWMVRTGLKHGMMTAPETGQKILMKTDAPKPASSAEHVGHAGMKGMAQEMPHDQMEKSMAMDPAKPMDMGATAGHYHHGAGISPQLKWTVGLATLAALVAAVALTGWLVPIRFA